MYTFLETHQEFGAAGCKLIYGNGEIQNTCASTFPMPFNEFSSLFLLNRLFPRSRIFSARELDYWDHKDSRSVDCLSGACMMVRKSIVDKVGGFDDKIFMYADDVDFCMRILKEGYQIYYLSTETIVHYEGSGTKKTGKKNFSTLFQKESERYVINKHFGPGKAACYTLVVLAGSVFRIIFSILIFPLLMMKSKNEDKNLSDILSKYSSLLLWSINIKKLTRP
jgi:GT2 family glycosyltransferase